MLGTAKNTKEIYLSIYLRSIQAKESSRMAMTKKYHRNAFAQRQRAHRRIAARQEGVLFLVRPSPEPVPRRVKFAADGVHVTPGQHFFWIPLARLAAS